MASSISYLYQNGVHRLPEKMVVPDRFMDSCHLLMIKNIFDLVQVEIKAKIAGYKLTLFCRKCCSSNNLLRSTLSDSAQVGIQTSNALTAQTCLENPSILTQDRCKMRELLQLNIFPSSHLHDIC